MTATAAITVSDDGENSIVVTLGANLELSAARAQELNDVISSAGLLLCQCEIAQEANLEAFKIARKHGGRGFLTTRKTVLYVKHRFSRLTGWGKKSCDPGRFRISILGEPRTTALTSRP